MSKKSWTDKLNADKKPIVKRTEKAFADIPENSSMLIATPKIIADYLIQLPKGSQVDIKKIRRDLASEFHAEYTCPVTTGIFLRIVAEAAFEAIENGTPLEKVPPFWRAIDTQMKLAKKLSFGTDLIQEQRTLENI
ncbi:MAG: hypothetical protein KI790_17455 [Cyclobacteriaceae bacterium]|nr:hypothetical protein [Cyclobacteriaceae bacterium HetDA_MAG_MS6]